MTMHQFIFSSDRRIRISRHLVFWAGWYFYMVSTQVRNQTPDEIGMKSFIIYQFSVSANRILLQAAFCYPIVYFLVPQFLHKKKYYAFVLGLMLTIICTFVITYIDFIYIWSDRASPIFFDIDRVKPLSPFQSMYFAIYSNIHFTGSLVSCSIMLVAKYYKSWFIKQRENEMLQKENALAELQLLKSQIHPHFLFNTLNNIYALTLANLPKAATTVQKLSGMMWYMIHEGAESFVPVNKEINMLLDYIGLERIRYEDRLEITTEIQGSKDFTMRIAPLLMIPFVENCFKHGASKTIGKAYIRLFITMEGDWLDFTISNNQPDEPEPSSRRKRIGLLNVKKRLQLLYPGKHQLDIHSSKDSFTVSMRVKLVKQKSQTQEDKSFNKPIHHVP